MRSSLAAQEPNRLYRNRMTSLHCWPRRAQVLQKHTDRYRHGLNAREALPRPSGQQPGTSPVQTDQELEAYPDPEDDEGV
jgi:hypothetical protein